MNIRDGDIIKLRKDIERVRKHEESRRQREVGVEPKEGAETAAKSSGARSSPPSSVPIAARLRRMLERVVAHSSPSKESQEAIPEHVVTLLQAIREEPRFKRWLLTLETLPLASRNEQLKRMAFAFRVEDGNSIIAESFDRLQNSALFSAFCQSLRDEKQEHA